MIGKIYSSVTPFYDSAKGMNSFKCRPVLIISGPRNNDYTVLPVSTITHKEHVDPDYDVKVEPAEYPKLNLNRISYIRTHKQTVVHHASLVRQIGDLKTEYEELYLTVLEKLESFNKLVMNHAL
ncbi:MAG: type II toxin-antitoxin system PemK/MazF family toxin [Enterocloster sp.]